MLASAAPEALRMSAMFTEKLEARRPRPGALGLDRRVRGLLVHAEEKRDVRELREAPRAERPASFLVIRQLAIVAFHTNSSASLAKP